MFTILKEQLASEWRVRDTLTAIDIIQLIYFDLPKYFQVSF